MPGPSCARHERRCSRVNLDATGDDVDLQYRSTQAPEEVVLGSEHDTMNRLGFI